MRTCGIVQLLILQCWCLLIITAMPLDIKDEICLNSNNCNDNTTYIWHQIHNKIKELASGAKHLYEKYYEGQGFNSNTVDKICDPVIVHFPKFNATNSSEKEKAIELFSIFSYVSAALGNITNVQNEINSKNKLLLSELEKTLSGVKGILSNLSCFLCKKYHVYHVSVYYGPPLPRSRFDQKAQGCKMLKKYKHFIHQAVDATMIHHPYESETQNP
ncbi:leukemia inhibitory factor-like isoform X2 [Xenopus laevis]|uniref:Leukemia inhibitory factor n=1 Tax=Xenopus laevis TaxID=8355 RepID=A0A8J0U9U0_XENLA|nr:leukemia inhibitory factor-like isoform X2 [Xenopus laevis]